MERKGSVASSRHVSRAERARRFVRRHLPVLCWLPRYTAEDAVSDLVAGITIGLTLMPQSIAYAQLAGLMPRYGLYSAFMGGFVYMCLGTVKQVTIGPTSLMAIVTFQYTRELDVHFIFLLTFLSGLVQFTMGVLRLGFLVDFISKPVLSGFTSATSVIIIVSQLKYLFGLTFRVRGFINRLVALWNNKQKINPPDVILGVSSIFFLLALKRLGSMTVGPPENAIDGALPTSRQRVIRRVLWFISIGRNALCILLTSLAAWVIHSQYQEVPFAIIGEVVPGLPPFGPPSFNTTIGNRTYSFSEMVTELGTGIIVVPIVGVLANVAIAKAFSSGVAMDATQEMIALAVSNLLGSLVQSMPTCGAFTRSAVSQASGVRTPMVGLYTGSLVLLTLAFLMPCFFFIPRSTLAAVLICAVFFLIDISIVPELWRSNKRDLVTMLVTFLACLGLGVEMGLVLGMALDMTRLLHVWARPRLSITICCWGVWGAQECGGEYVLVRPSLGLLFPGVDTLRHLVDEAGLTEGQGTLPVVVDCAPVLALDYTGVKAFEALVNDFKARGQQLLFMAVDPEVRDMLTLAKLYNSLNFCEDEDDLPAMLFGERLQSQAETALSNAVEWDKALSSSGSEVEERAVIEETRGGISLATMQSISENQHVNNRIGGGGC